jgi:hypothetical protein
MNDLITSNLAIISEFMLDQEYELNILISTLKKHLNTDTSKVAAICLEVQKKAEVIKNDVDPLLNKMQGSYLDKAKAILHLTFHGEINLRYSKLILDKILKYAEKDLASIALK